MKPIKVVFDTNVYLAAIQPNSYARLQLKRCQPNGPYRPYISPEVIIEIRRKLETKFGYPAKNSAEFIDMVLRYAALIQPRQRVTGVLRDSDDHKILECALEAKADLPITADRQLLRLKQFNTTRIGHPSMLKYRLH